MTSSAKASSLAGLRCRATSRSAAPATGVLPNTSTTAIRRADGGSLPDTFEHLRDEAQGTVDLNESVVAVPSFSTDFGHLRVDGADVERVAVGRGTLWRR